MSKRRILQIIPALCAALIAWLMWLRPGYSDFHLGLMVGVLVGVSIVAVVKLRRHAAR